MAILSRAPLDLGTLSVQTPTNPICFGHRGARAHAPENTLLAFDLAFDLGADGIECDAQLSADGKVVIIHDSTVNRTTNGRGRVAELDLAELRALDAGRLLRIPQRIPTLEETLALIWRRGGRLNLELKADTESEAVAVAEAVAPILNAIPTSDHLRDGILISSFKLSAVTRMRQLTPWARFGALYGGRAWTRATMIETAKTLRVDAIHPHPGIMTDETVRAAHDDGLRVNVWTANRQATIRQLINWGVDGIFSDFPERVVTVRRLTSISGGLKEPRNRLS
jgi:glycerophosphoryl diester phosphodiesterase